MNLQWIAQYLIDSVGSRLTTVAIGKTDANFIKDLAGGEKREIDYDTAYRLLLFQECVEEIRRVYTRNTAAAYFTGTSELLGGTPLLAISKAKTLEDYLNIKMDIKAFLY